MKNIGKGPKEKFGTGNKLQDINRLIDEESKMVKQYFDEHNIPYVMENGIPIRTDLPDFIEMTCKKCKKSHNMPYNTYMDLLEQYDPFEEEEFLVIECIYCHKGDMLPKKYMDQLVTLKKHK